MGALDQQFLFGMTTLLPAVQAMLYINHLPFRLFK
ncbi:Uncharacterised protein [Vibrio cholerae]|nr:Uncharacterised protein [Vibrio cholerae]